MEGGKGGKIRKTVIAQSLKCNKKIDYSSMSHIKMSVCWGLLFEIIRDFSFNI